MCGSETEQRLRMDVILTKGVSVVTGEHWTGTLTINYGNDRWYGQQWCVLIRVISDRNKIMTQTARWEVLLL